MKEATVDSKIKASFWSDSAVEMLEPMEKLALLWLFTAHVSHCGWASATPKRFQFETGLEWRTLERACEALGEGLVRGKDGWWIRNYIRHQIGDGEKLRKNNMSTPIKASMAFAPTTIVAEIVKEYPALFPENESPPEALLECSRSTRVEQSRAEVLVRKEGVGGNPPTEEEVMAFANGCAQVLITKPCALRWLTDRETAEWMRPKGQHMLPVLPNWQADLRGYAMDWNRNEQDRKTKNGSEKPKVDEDGWTHTR